MYFCFFACCVFNMISVFLDNGSKKVKSLKVTQNYGQFIDTDLKASEDKDDVELLSKKFNDTFFNKKNDSECVGMIARIAGITG